ncbi:MULTISPECIES: alpha/beta hydrolase [unclassified Chelatococcus]|uniref:alpha/beta fold hydrolase n=1 Tax=unclassified Chelatococcus TaxID=2638111 RepID=UPI001BCAA933|nr:MULTISPECIES: alpha/beta hydrolase [unclassified Chelatococcus]MBS7743438.1 alpha/beta hydrolase [Chelatococcus sp. HY11]MBX3547185.1 alpha/beta hydrolase [Chelatococcus sp.]
MHGGAQSRRAWSRGLMQLAKAGYHAIAVDTRGHGDSDWAPDGLYAAQHWAEDFERLLIDLGRDDPRPIAIVGASRGGQSALIAAVEQPSRVSCLVLVDMTPQTSSEGAEKIGWFLKRSARGFRSVAEASEFLATFSNRPSPENADGLRRIMREDSSGLLFWQWDPRIAEDDFVRPPSEPVIVEAAARRTTHPVLLIRAGKSELVRDQDVAHFRSVLPSLQVVEIPNIGHMLTADSNDTFMPPVLDFLSRHHRVSP